MKTLIALITIMLVGFSAIFGQGPPKIINYQGYLKDSGGNPINDTRTLTFEIYKTETGGNPQWTEVHQNKMIENGFFQVTLGTETSLILSFDESYWLSIKVGNDPPLVPRMRLTSAAYSFYSINAANAENISDNIVTEAKIQDGAVTASKIDISASGDLTGNYPDPSIANLQGSPLSIGGTPSSGQVLKWNGTAWAPGQDETGTGGNTVNVTPRLDGDGSASAPLDIHQQGATQGQVLTWNGTWMPADDGAGGPASGDLTGSYPNPSIASDAVSSGKIQDRTIQAADISQNTITSAELATGAVASDEIQDGTISAADIGQNSVTADKILDEPGTAYEYGPSIHFLPVADTIKQRIDTLIISVPRSGVVVVEASGYVNLFHTSGTADNIAINVQTNPNESLFTWGVSSFYIPAGLLTNNYRYAFSCGRVFEVTSASMFTVFLTIQHLEGSSIQNTAVGFPVLLARYYPTSYDTGISKTTRGSPVSTPDGFSPRRR